MMQPQTPAQQRLFTHYGPWAVVTGASSGIGREIAQQLAAAGLHLVLSARSKPTLEQLAAKLSAQHGIQTLVVDLDMALAESAVALDTATQDLDIGLVVLAAGFGSTGPFLQANLTQELEMLDVNCRAVTALSWHFGQRLVRRGRGGMILLSSILGFQGAPNSAHYAATKAYVQALGEALYVELAPHGVAVLASAPGPTNSGFAARANMNMGAVLTPSVVAQSTLQALGRQPTVLPGALSKLLVYSLAFLPRALRVRIMGRAMGSMAQPH